MFKFCLYIKCLLLALSLSTVLQISAQHTQNLNPSTDQLIDSLRDVSDYSSTHREWTFKELDIDPDTSEPSLSNNSGLALGAGAFIKFLIYGLIIVAIVFLIVIMVRGERSRDLTIETSFNNLETEDDLINYDAQEAYRAALAEGNYRVALRMQFIQVLQYLAENKLIKWKPDKTNRDYTRELRGQEDFEHFRVLSAAFEQIWYGNKPLTEQEFHQYDSHFAHYLKRVL